MTGAEQTAKADLEVTEEDLAGWQGVLSMAIQLDGNCHAAYVKARPSERRRFNEAVLEAVYVKDRKIPRAEFSEVFAPLFSRPSSNKALKVEVRGVEPLTSAVRRPFREFEDQGKYIPNGLSPAILLLVASGYLPTFPSASRDECGTRLALTDGSFFSVRVAKTRGGDPSWRGLSTQTSRVASPRGSSPSWRVLHSFRAARPTGTSPLST